MRIHRLVARLGGWGVMGHRFRGEAGGGWKRDSEDKISEEGDTCAVDWSEIEERRGDGGEKGGLKRAGGYANNNFHLMRRETREGRGRVEEAWLGRCQRGIRRCDVACSPPLSFCTSMDRHWGSRFVMTAYPPLVHAGVERRGVLASDRATQCAKSFAEEGKRGVRAHWEGSCSP